MYSSAPVSSSSPAAHPVSRSSAVRSWSWSTAAATAASENRRPTTAAVWSTVNARRAARPTAAPRPRGPWPAPRPARRAQAGQLHQEERVAGRPLVPVTGALAGQVVARHGTQQVGCAGGVQAGQLEPERVTAGERLRGHRQLPRRLRVGPSGPHQRQRAVLRCLRDQVGQHPQADLVGPVQVLQDQQDRACGGAGEDRADDPLGRPERHSSGLRSGAGMGRQDHPGRRGRGRTARSATARAAARRRPASTDRRPPRPRGPGPSTPGRRRAATCRSRVRRAPGRGRAFRRGRRSRVPRAPCARWWRPKTGAAARATATRGSATGRVVDLEAGSCEAAVDPSAGDCRKMASSSTRSCGPGSSPSSSASTARTVRRASRASACLPARVRARAWMPQRLSRSGNRDVAGSVLASTVECSPSPSRPEQPGLLRGLAHLLEGGPGRQHVGMVGQVGVRMPAPGAEHRVEPLDRARDLARRRPATRLPGLHLRGQRSQQLLAGTDLRREVVGVDLGGGDLEHVAVIGRPDHGRLAA